MLRSQDPPSHALLLLFTILLIIFWVVELTELYFSVDSDLTPSPAASLPSPLHGYSLRRTHVRVNATQRAA